jgi:multidrug efflux pump subunit AcrA (membrane-fusion protein)
MKLNKKTAGLFIFASLLLVLFFSKTVYTYQLPEVTGVKPLRGSLSKLEVSSGIAAWAETENMYAAVGGAVGAVLVKEGDRVEKGQPLFYMDFEITAAERKLAETGHTISKTEGDIQNTQSRLTSIRDALKASELPDDLPLVPGQVGIISLEINKARLTMKNARLSFELGSLSLNEALDAENNFRALIFKYQAEAEDLEYSLNAKKMDLLNLALARETCRELLRDYRDNALVSAPEAGLVETLYAEKGRYFAENALLLSLGIGGEFTVNCTVSLDNNFIAQGDTCELSNASHVLKGTVTRIKPSAQGKIVSVAVVAGVPASSGEISAGETFEVTFEKDSAASFTLAPNASVNQDSGGYFLYQIKRRRGIMGEEYYLERLDVFTGDSDYRNTVITRGITFFEPVVLTATKPLSAGITVVLKNPEDFFEN